MKSCLSVACRPAVGCSSGKNLMLPGQFCHLVMDHGNKIKHELDFIFTKFTKFYQSIIFYHSQTQIFYLYRFTGMPDSCLVSSLCAFPGRGYLPVAHCRVSRNRPQCPQCMFRATDHLTPSRMYVQSYT